MFVYSIRIMDAKPLAASGLLLASVSFGIVVSTAIGNQRRPARDERMFENIVEASDEGDLAILVIGENHVKGIAGHAAATGVGYDAYWLSSTADLDEESSE